MTARVVQVLAVFDRHAGADLSTAYAVLVPQRRARTGAAGGKEPCDDERGDLRPGLLGPAEEGRDDRLADRRAARPRRKAAS